MNISDQAIDNGVSNNNRFHVSTKKNLVTFGPITKKFKQPTFTYSKQNTVYGA